MCPDGDKTPVSDDDYLRLKARLEEQSVEEIIAFLRLDNQIVGHLETILGALAAHVEENPNAVFEPVTEVRTLRAATGSEEVPLAIDPIWEKIIDCLCRIITPDKELIKFLIDKFF